MIRYYYSKGFGEKNSETLRFCDDDSWIVNPHFIQRNTKVWVKHNNLNQSSLSIAYDEHSIHDVHIHKVKQ